MKVFISWSGELSKSLAEILRQWLPGVIQAAKPYYSPDDITKGTRWSSEISKELDASKIGIICLTKDNLESPWIMFEAGALSKNIDKSKVCPLLFNIEPSDIQGPLVQFQASKFSKVEMKKLVKMMNTELNDSSLTGDVLDSVFDMWWPRLQEKVEAELRKIVPKETPQSEIRPERDILEEILFLSRELSISKSKRGEKERLIDPGAIDYFLRKFEELTFEVRGLDQPRLMELMNDIYKPLEHMIETFSMDASRGFGEEMIYRLRQIRMMTREDGRQGKIRRTPVPTRKANSDGDIKK
jgi:hypothetical protein